MYRTMSGRQRRISIKNRPFLHYSCSILLLFYITSLGVNKIKRKLTTTEFLPKRSAQTAKNFSDEIRRHVRDLWEARVVIMKKICLSILLSNILFCIICILNIKKLNFFEDPLSPIAVRIWEVRGPDSISIVRSNHE